jgi:hypothetical protein
LVPARASVEVPVFCVERGRWSYRSRRFESPGRVAYPTLRHAGHTLGQEGVWRDLHAKSIRLGATSATDAAEAMYTRYQRRLDEYVAALPCRAGQCGSLVAIAGAVVCLDLISRPDVHARVYPNLVRGYALDAVEAPAEPLPAMAAEDALTEIAEAPRERVQTEGAGGGRLLRLRSDRVRG